LRKLIWVRADGDEPWQFRESFVKTAIESGADAVFVNPGEAGKVVKLGAIMVASEEEAPGVGVVVFHVPAPQEAEGVLREIESLRSSGKKAAVLIEVRDKETERMAVRLGKASDFLLVTARDWKIIPLENIIAELQGSGASILAGVKNAEEAKTAVQTLEVGTAGVLLDVREAVPDEIKRTCEALEELTAEKLELAPARIKTLRAVGMGDRACIDTTSFMQLGEGMLVGSQAEGLFLVHSETLPTEFVEARPFRVNAGAVHAYIRVPGGKTKYMSELQAGDEVLMVNTKGEARTGVIGRVKIEKRPLILVEAECAGKTYKTLLQNAETINLVGRDGKPVSVTKLKPGDEVLIYIEAGGRHFGVRVEETLIEK
jgi:3-dehydroquinate synthase II